MPDPLRFVEATAQDVRGARRALAGNPLFAAAMVLVLVLALGIGASGTLFTLTHTVLLRELPVMEPDRLVEPVRQYPGDPWLSSYSIEELERFVGDGRLLAAAAGSRTTRVDVSTDAGAAAPALVEQVTDGYFALLGLSAWTGR